MTATTSQELTSQTHHRAAAMMHHARTRLQRPPPPLPRADGAIVKAALALMMLGAAATAGAIWWTKPVMEGEIVAQPARVGDISLMVPRDLTGVEPGDTSRLVGMVRLRLSWPSFGPVGADSEHRLLVTLSPPDKVNEPATQLATYARFLTPTVWSNPGGLVVRGFRKGSPFERDEFYVSVPDGRGFAARCPIESGPLLDEPCRVTFRHRGMDVNIRFPRAVIADWELMLGGVRRSIDRMMR